MFRDFFEKYLPIVIRNLFTPMFTIAIMVPLTLLAFGPIGNTIGGAIGGIYNTLYNLSPIVAGFVVGGIWEILVIFGVHWGITPVTVGNYANLGYDTFTGLQSAAVFSQAGATLGVFLKTKNKEMKGVSASAAYYRIVRYYRTCYLRCKLTSKETYDLRMYCRCNWWCNRWRFPYSFMELQYAGYCNITCIL